MSLNVIAIDGPAASGKSTVAQRLAARLGYTYISTGAMFRAIAWKLTGVYGSLRDFSEAELKQVLDHVRIRYEKNPADGKTDIMLDGIFPGAALRSADMALAASRVSAIPLVRSYTAKWQRELAENQTIVMEGRDIGTVIFPDAKVKFFLTASPRVRAIRRLSQNGEAPDGSTVDSVAAEIEQRDQMDMTRAIAPLKQAEDAVLIDNSELNIEQTLEKMCQIIQEKEQTR